MKNKTERRNKAAVVFAVVVIMLLLSTIVFSQTSFIKRIFSKTGESRSLGTTGWVSHGFQFVLRIYLVKNVVWGGFFPKYVTSFSNNFYIATMANPSPRDPGIYNFILFLVRIIQPIYSLVIMFIAFYLLFMPVSPASRAKAKYILTRLLISMVCISLSIPIVELLLELSAGITDSVFGLVSPVEIKEVLGGAAHNVFWVFALTSVAHEEIGLPYLMLMFAIAFIPYIVIGLRYILITMFIALFPLGVLLYTLPGFKGIGKKMLEQLIVWTFLQVFIALIIVVFVGMGITIEPAFVNHAEISFTNLRFLYDSAATLAAAGTGLIVGTAGGYFPNFWGALIGTVGGGVAGLLTAEFVLDEFYDAMPPTLSIVNFVLGIIIYAMLIIFPLIWSSHLHDFLP